MTSRATEDAGTGWSGPPAGAPAAVGEREPALLVLADGEV